MSTHAPVLATKNRMEKRHRDLIAVGFAIQLLDVELFKSHEETKVDVYVAQLYACRSWPNQHRPTMPVCLHPYADEAQW